MYCIFFHRSRLIFISFTEERQISCSIGGTAITGQNSDIFQTAHPQRRLQATTTWCRTRQRWYVFCLSKKCCHNYIIIIFTDAQDYFTLILLNAVLPPTSRILNQNGKRNQKLTIADAQLSMVLWLSILNDYERRINNIVRKSI